MHSLGRLGVASSLFFFSAIAVAVPSAPAGTAPGPAPGAPSVLTYPIKVDAGVTLPCGSAYKANVRLTRALATPGPVTGRILFGLQNAKPTFTDFTVAQGSLGAVTTVQVNHPQIFDCASTLRDLSVEVWLTGGSAPIYKKSLAAKSFFGDKLLGPASASGPSLAKVSLKGTCGGGGSGTVHVEPQSGNSNPVAATVAMTFAGATVTKSVTVPYLNPAQDPSFGGAGPINCKLNTGLAPFTWTVQPGGSSGTFGPTGFNVVFNDD